MWKAQVIPAKKIDDISYTAGQRVEASADLAKMGPVTKKVGQWADELAVQEYLKQGFKMTGKNRMSYSAPEWIAECRKPVVYYFLDDWNRADMRFIQACNGVR